MKEDSSFSLFFTWLCVGFNNFTGMLTIYPSLKTTIHNDISSRKDPNIGKKGKNKKAKTKTQKALNPVAFSVLKVVISFCYRLVILNSVHDLRESHMLQM